MAAVELPVRDEDPDRPPRQIPGVEYGLDFLMELHRGEEKTVGRRVAVVGAGFTALDCARTARRSGAKEVAIHIRTTEEYIPVTKDEIFEAKREGITIHGLRSPVNLVTGDEGQLSCGRVRAEPAGRLARKRPAARPSRSRTPSSWSPATP